MQQLDFCRLVERVDKMDRMLKEMGSRMRPEFMDSEDEDMSKEEKDSDESSDSYSYGTP